MTIFKNLLFCYVVHNLHETKKCFLVASGSETTHVQTKVTISRRDIIKCFINITNKIDISEKQSFTCHTIHHIILEAVPSYFIQKSDTTSSFGALKTYFYNNLFICRFMPKCVPCFSLIFTKQLN